VRPLQHIECPPDATATQVLSSNGQIWSASRSHLSTSSVLRRPLAAALVISTPAPRSEQSMLLTKACNRPSVHLFRWS
jgi:hypothetical protein